MSETLQEIIDWLWVAPENGEWTPKTDVVSLADLRRWLKSPDIEVQGFASGIIGDGRFRIEPPLPFDEFLHYVMGYYGRCLRENPDGKWSDSRYSAGWTLVNIFAALWNDPLVPRGAFQELKTWLGRLYKEGNPEIRTCIVQGTLEHLVEQEEFRDLFSDWINDPVLAIAHKEASEWYLGGGSTPLGLRYCPPQQRRG